MDNSASYGAILVTVPSVEVARMATAHQNLKTSAVGLPAYLAVNS